MPFTSLPLVAVLLGSLVQSRPFVAPPISSFNGSAWAGLSIGASTDSDVKKAYKIEKGAIRPEALRLTQRTAPAQVDALLDGRGGKAKITAFRIEYPAAATVGALAAEAGEKPKNVYQKARREDWHLAVFPTKGVIAVVEGKDRSKIVYLVGPSKVGRMIEGYSTKEEPVTVVRDPFAGQTIIAKFGSVSVTYDDRPIGIKDKPEDQKDWERYLRGIRADGAAMFESGAPGYASINVRTQYDVKRGGNITVTGNFTGTCQYGTVSASTSSTESLPAADTPTKAANLELQGSIAYTKAVLTVQKNFEIAIAERVLSQGPPPINRLRLAALDKLLEDAGRPVLVATESLTFGAIVIEIKDDRPSYRKTASRLAALREAIEAKISAMVIPGLRYAPGAPGQVLVKLDSRRLGGLDDVHYEISALLRIEATSATKSLRVDYGQAITPDLQRPSDAEPMLEGIWLEGLDPIIATIKDKYVRELSAGKFGKPITEVSDVRPIVRGPFVFGVIDLELTGNLIGAKERDFITGSVAARIRNIEDPAVDRSAVLGTNPRILEAVKGELKYLAGKPGRFSLKVQINEKSGKVIVTMDGSIEAMRGETTLKVSERMKYDFDGGKGDLALLRLYTQFCVDRMSQLFDQKLAELK